MTENANEDMEFCCLCRAISHFKKSEACHHIRNARREMLLAAKSLIETCIEKLDEKDGKPNQAHKVEIS